APLAPWVNTLLRYLAGDAARLDLPLDVEATAFQQRVWQALRAIPYGETRSYGAVAEAIGQPGAARAVARACAANPVALVIPRHRRGGRTSFHHHGVRGRLVARAAARAARHAAARGHRGDRQAAVPRPRRRARAGSHSPRSQAAKHFDHA